MAALAGRHDGAGVVVRAAVGDEHLEAARVVVLGEQGVEGGAEEAPLVAHRHEDGEEGHGRGRRRGRPPGRAVERKLVHRDPP